MDKQKVFGKDKPWLKNYDEFVPEHIDYDEITLSEMFENSVEMFSEKDALIFQGYRMTFREMKECVNKFAACLTEFGIRKGDAVAVLLPNMIPTVTNKM